MGKIEMAINIIAHSHKTNKDLTGLLDTYDCPAGSGKLTDEEKEVVGLGVMRKLVYNEARHHAEIEDPALVVLPEDHEEWYEDWLLANKDNMYYWKRLSDFLEHKLQEHYDPREAGAIVRSIDVASDKIIGRLERPERPRFQTKGLVVGHVQSGKTANFTAVIAKAVDCGYRLIIVLTGIHNNLRSQTQQRLDCELTGEPDITDLPNIGLPKPEWRQWVRMTNHELDFDKMHLNLLKYLAEYRRPMLAVMKKNCTVMQRLIEWLREAPDEVREEIPLLLIDDEADQASIDTNHDKNTDPSKTNALIRTILSNFPRHAYVGYTATPFANVLIDMRIDDPELGKNLYPRNFIVSLPRPAQYMGAEQIFTQGKDHHFVRLIKEDELPDLIPKSSNVHRIPQGITPMLARSIYSFCLAGAARLQRRHGDKAMTMLIHTTHLTAGHGRMKSVVEPFCDSLRARWSDKYEGVRLKQDLQDLWDGDFKPTTGALGYDDRVCDFDVIEPFIGLFLDELRVLELNCATDDELDYTRNPSVKAIAIGGNRLSRGLTLEGLMTSFYLRHSRAYDTLLQMGRWFGYRQEYEDLTRVFTSGELDTHFADLAMVEQELREEIYHYEDEGLTPAEVAVRIRGHKTLRITAPNKMGAATQVQGSFSGRLAQTIWFPLDRPDLLRHNLNLGDAFIKSIPGWKQPDTTWKRYLAEKVAVDRVLDFLRDYKFEDRHAGLDSTEMIAYIERHVNDELREWNVCVAGRATSPGDIPEVMFGGLSMIPVQRSRVKGTLKTGVLSDPRDLRIDLSDPSGDDPHVGRPSNQPLLVLYRVWRKSKPRAGSKNLEPLFRPDEQKEDVLGLAIVFPRSVSEPNHYFSQIIGG